MFRQGVEATVGWQREAAFNKNGIKFEGEIGDVLSFGVLVDVGLC